MNNYEFTASTMTVNGKTFPVEFSISTDSVTVFVEMGEGRKAEKIRFDSNHPDYEKARAAAEAVAAAWKAKREGKTEERPEIISETEAEAAPETVTEERPETISETEEQEEKTMPVYEIGYDDDGIFSINMMQATDAETARAAAELHAAHFGYKVAYVNELAPWQVKENRERGMPFEIVEERPEIIPEAEADTEAEAAEELTEEIAEERPEIIPETEAEAAPEATEAETQRPALEELNAGKAARGPVPEKTFAGEAISGNGWSIIFDTGLNRTRVIVSERIKEAAAPIIEKAGFYYSKVSGSWNKRLTHRAYRSALALADDLRSALA